MNRGRNFLKNFHRVFLRGFHWRTLDEEEEVLEYLLQENGDFLLQETGDRIKL